MLSPFPPDSANSNRFYGKYNLQFDMPVSTTFECIPVDLNSPEPVQPSNRVSSILANVFRAPKIPAPILEGRTIQMKIYALSSQPVNAKTHPLQTKMIPGNIKTRMDVCFTMRIKDRIIPHSNEPSLRMA